MTASIRLMRMLCTEEYNLHSFPSRSNELELWSTTQEVKDAETTTNSSSSLVLVILSVLALVVILSVLVLLLILSVLYNQGP